MGSPNGSEAVSPSPADPRTVVVLRPCLESYLKASFSRMRSVWYQHRRPQTRRILQLPVGRKRRRREAREYSKADFFGGTSITQAPAHMNSPRPAAGPQRRGLARALHAHPRSHPSSTPHKSLSKRNANLITHMQPKIQIPEVGNFPDRNPISRTGQSGA